MKIKTIELEDGQVSSTIPTIDAPQGVTGLQGYKGAQGIGNTGISSVGALSDAFGSNAAIGLGEGACISGLVSNVGIGVGTLPSGTNGYNTAIGYQSLISNALGSGNVGVGYQSNMISEDNTYSIGVGYWAGSSHKDYAGFCVGIGYKATAYHKGICFGIDSNSVAQDSIIFGNDMAGEVYSGETIAQNQVVLGGENITSTILRGVVRIEDEATYSDIEGTMRYDSTAHLMKIYNGTAWVDL